MYYDEKEKQDFIESISSSYIRTCKIVFRHSASLEEKLNKNLYDFNLKDLSVLFGKFKMQKNTYISRKFVLLKYFDYYRSLRIDKNNPLLLVDSKWDEQFIDTTGRQLISEKDFNELISSFYNKQDAALCQLLFEGVGAYEISEILNLKKNDINWHDRTLNLKGDKKGKRQLEVSERCIDLLAGAIEQEIYYSNNGQAEAGTSRGHLVENEYVIRPSNTKKIVKSEKSRADRALVYRRFNILKKFSPNFNITTKTVAYSGMMKAAIELSKKTGVPIEKFKNSTHWIHIAQKFNVSPSPRAGGNFSYPGVTGHIDSEIINQFYDELAEEQISNFVLVSKEDLEKQEVTRKKRDVPASFKQLIMSVYEKCAITGETFLDVLDACHIQPYINKDSDHIQNGLLLRTDIHRLFDKGLLLIDEDYIVKVNSSVDSDYYQSFHNKKINLPKNESFYPSKEALSYNINLFKNK
ncbi:HNH endonuclease [Priestia megaterium]|uniref:phage lytic cycle repressor MrpR family protein n=1 Tax=Priestia megaterium TaxID=1404 RepID=UPI0036D947CD